MVFHADSQEFLVVVCIVIAFYRFSACLGYDSLRYGNMALRDNGKKDRQDYT
jgi:hypothetical protein